MKPNIAIIHPSFFVYGGAERQIAYLCNWLTYHDYPVTIITTQMIPDMKKALKDTRYVAIPHQQSFVNFVRSVAHKFDILNPHNHPAELIHVPIKMPVVWQANEPPGYVLQGAKLSPRERMLVRKYVTKAMVITDFEKERFERLYGFEPILNYPGVKYDFFSEPIDNPKDKYGINGRNPVLLEPGYITWTKNQVKAVETLAEVKKEYKDAGLVLAGHDKDPYTNQVKARAKELGVTKDVIITGYLDGDEDFRDLYHLADVYLGPFATHQGGWATTFEAMVCKCPTVISDNFVATKLVEDNNLGVICKLEDFSENVLKQLSNPIVPDPKWIENNLTWDKFSERYDKVFMEMYNEN